MLSETISELQSLYSDMYKDAYNVRPRNNFMEWSIETLNAEIEWLQETISYQLNEQKTIQNNNSILFEQRINETIAIGAKDRETAIRWIIDAENADGDINYLEYLLNLPYGYLQENNNG